MSSTRISKTYAIRKTRIKPETVLSRKSLDRSSITNKCMMMVIMKKEVKKKKMLIKDMIDGYDDKLKMTADERALGK